ncbi:MAG: PTS sugar transporter subunit IIB [Cardiobacteriaceae bacterium]|nr:PTS sugar transporter subunit IIB [Cardiobacteriaceae bacterium]
MKILAVCGFGVGSSMVLKFTIEKAAAELGMAADVENTDLTSAQSMDADAIFTSYQLADQLKAAVQVPVFPVRNYMDLNEVKAQLATLPGGAS